MADTLSKLGEKAQALSERGKWGHYRNVRYETAERVREDGDGERAGYLYVEVMIFDLQGATSASGASGFSSAHQGPTPAVAREVARFTLREEMDVDTFKTAYDRVADRFWIDAFPRSRADVWDDLQEIVWQYREMVQLEDAVKTLDGDQLLPDEAARRYAELKDDYDLLRRVEHLLEAEPPTRIPRRKQERAHLFLSAVDVDALSDRWRAKAFRWGGAVMLSDGQPERALTYFEQALEGADQFDRVAVERLVKQLRPERGPAEPTG